ncbi:TetR/AcrR family transcriptional regulator [Thermosyntropha sp.]|uniref:TetR/AcrR family transcriptional regulator n=1 Tax=Thermosyntropha sp. TaxID=2740820 RepID=UPI0025FF0D22|nr:TetR/AcrR family transcriptional regulator [Thermosyntropha sp.]MBO8159423.1 TetR/AcrR family transcriptional regulator [Thermosyntropha sp.]
MSSESREKIIEAARKVISENGIAGATVRSIAKEAGVSTGAIYHYYASKEDILYDIIDESLTASARVAEKSKEGKSNREEIIKDVYDNLMERFKKTAENKLQFYLTHEVMLGNSQLEERFQKKYDEWISRIEDILVNTYGAEENIFTRALAAWLLAAVDGMVLQDLLNAKGADDETIMRVFFLLLEEGIPHFLTLLKQLEQIPDN